MHVMWPSHSFDCGLALESLRELLRLSYLERVEFIKIRQYHYCRYAVGSGQLLISR